MEVMHFRLLAPPRAYEVVVVSLNDKNDDNLN